MKPEGSVPRETSHTEKANTVGPHLYVESRLKTHSSKFRDAPNLSALSHLDFLHEPEMKSYQSPGLVSKVYHCKHRA